MEVFICIILFVVLLIVIGNFKKEVKKNLQIVNRNVIKIQRELTADKTSIVEKGTVTSSVTAQNKPITSGLKFMNPAPPKKEEKQAPKEEKPKITESPIQKVKVVKAIKPVTKPETPIIKKEKRDYEKLIGENWLNKIGIAVLVLGIAFFRKVCNRSKLDW